MHDRRSYQRACRTAFTLVEILTVVMILAIIGAVVIPQFAGASDDAKLNALKADLQMVRSQLELYRLQHGGQYPTSAAKFPAQMTTYTDTSHAASATKTGNYVLGPYLMEVPNNPYTETNDVTTSAAGATKAWFYNPATGEFRTNDKLHDSL